MNAHSNILYACAGEQQRGKEQFVPEHTLGYVLSGENRIYSRQGTSIYKAGMMGLVRRNQLIKSVKVPPSGAPFKAINIVLGQEHLSRYVAENPVKVTGRYEGDWLLELSPNPFLKGYFDSLLPYFDHAGQLTGGLTALKTQEAIELLLRHSHALGHNLKAFLFDLGEPYKIDLEAFMNQHYMYNIPADRFAKLTGRSLASFKRDFQKVFGTSPQKWLLHKRLDRAHFLIAHRKQRPSDVYLEVGFENLSHFSAVFKEKFGYNPSSVSTRYWEGAFQNYVP